MQLTAKQLAELAAALRGYAAAIDDLAGTLAEHGPNQLSYPDWSSTARLAAVAMDDGQVRAS